MEQNAQQLDEVCIWILLLLQYYVKFMWTLNLDDFLQFAVNFVGKLLNLNRITACYSHYMMLVLMLLLSILNSGYI